MKREGKTKRPQNCELDEKNYLPVMVVYYTLLFTTTFLIIIFFVRECFGSFLTIHLLLEDFKLKFQIFYFLFYF